MQTIISQFTSQIILINFKTCYIIFHITYKGLQWYYKGLQWYYMVVACLNKKNLLACNVVLDSSDQDSSLLI